MGRPTLKSRLGKGQGTISAGRNPAGQVVLAYHTACVVEVRQPDNIIIIIIIIVQNLQSAVMPLGG